MSQLVMFDLVSVDGFYAGADGNIDWHNVDDEFNKFAVEQTKSFGTIIFGRTTYQLFESFWPAAMHDPKMSAEDREIGRMIDEVEKVVYSSSLKDVTWKNSRLFPEVTPGEVAQLKQREGKDMVIYGSGTVVQQFARLGLIDEYRFVINPVVLGNGKRLFREKMGLKLLSSRSFGNGNVLLCYQATRPE